MEAAASSKPAIFTAARISEKLGNRTPQAVRKTLSAVPDNGKVIVRGIEAKAWHFSSLPEQIKAELIPVAQRRGYRDPEHYLSDEGKKRWHSILPLNECNDHDVDVARKLQRAMLPSFDRQHQVGLSAMEFERLGVIDYKAEFGHEITTKYWRQLFQRTVDRDDNALNWSDLEIYLCERPMRRPDASSPPNESESPWATLLVGIENPLTLSPSGERLLWRRSFRQIEDEVDSGNNAKTIKEELFKFLSSQTNLAKSRNALRVNWQRKYERWVFEGRPNEGLPDLRIEANERRRKVIPEEYIHKVATMAKEGYECAIAPAVRYFRATGEIPPEVTGTGWRPAPSLMEAVSPKVAMTEGFGLRGSKQRRTKLTGDRSGMFSLDEIECDDMTPNFYCYIPDGDWYRLIRPQTLLSVDGKSRRFLGWHITPSESYGGDDICGLFKGTFRIGFPKRLGLEKASWRSSKFVHGRMNPNLPTQTWEDFELGISALIPEIGHTQGPTGKSVIEGSIGAIQKLMPREWGFCGRDEARDCPEETRLNKLKVQGRKEHPGKYFYNFERFVERMDDLVKTYNNLPQRGELDGLTPNQAFEKFQNPNDPPMKLDESNIHNLDYHQFPREVTSQGISFPHRKGTLRYFGAATSPFQSQIVRVYFDPHEPDAIRFKPKRSNQIFTVERHIPCKRGDTDSLEFKREIAKAHAHDAFPKAVFRAMEVEFKMKYRQNLNAPAVESIGKQIKEQNAALSEKKREEQTRQRSIQRSARAMGVDADVFQKDPQSTEAAARLAKFMADSDDEDAETPAPGGLQQ